MINPERAMTDHDDALKALGFDGRHIACFEQMLERPTGINAFSGPTGSGKTTTLEYELKRFVGRFPNWDRATVGPPPEYWVARAAAIPVERTQPAQRREVRGPFRAVTRGGGHLIVVDEMRNGESLQSAITAVRDDEAKVWTTLHANNAWGILDRCEAWLKDAGVRDGRALLADTSVISGLSAQRLIYKLCPSCSVPMEEAIRQNRVQRETLRQLEVVFDDMSTHNIRVRGDGCARCLSQRPSDERAASPSRGILGRTVVAETIVSDAEVMDCYRRYGAGEAERFWIEQRAGRTCTHHAIEKVRDGLVDPESAMAVVGALTG